MIQSELTHLCQVDLSTLTLWTDLFPVSSKRGVWLVLLLQCFIEIPFEYLMQTV